MRRLLGLLLVLGACAPAVSMEIPSTTQATTTTTSRPTTTTTLPSTTTTQPVVFDEPVNLAVDRDGTIWVVERGGRVVSVDGEVLIDLEIDLSDAHQERGLLSVEFWEGGYWLYVAWPETGISELWALEYGDTELLGEPLRSWGPAPWHFGGGMEYHEPWLYIAIGDGATSGFTADQPQAPSPDRGAILRYHNGSGRWELAASGLRNPWSWTLQDGIFYIGDVGAQDAEEINVAPLDGVPNFGWPIFEGSSCVDDPDCEDMGYVMPALEYRNEGIGNAVVLGGVVGDELVWTDFFTGTIHYTELATMKTRTVETDLMPTAMIVHHGDVWVASIDGRVGPIS